TKPASIREAPEPNARKMFWAATWRPPRVPRRLVRALQGRRPVAHGCGAVLRIRLGGHPLGLAAAVFGNHVCPRDDRLGRVEAGLRHELLADLVGLGLLRA